MAHRIPVEDGRAMMMYAGEVPWHGLGTALDGPATSAEAITAARLDWEVVRRPLRACGSDGVAREVVDSHVALTRADLEAKGSAEAVLSVVGRGYEVLQNREAFAFFDRVVGLGRAVYETAGAIDGGRIIWILARLPDDLVTDNGERIRPYILLSNGHGRLVPVSLKLTAVRVVCANTMTMSLEMEAGQVAKIAHDGSMRAKLEGARELLGLIDRATLELRRFAERLRRVSLGEDALAGYLGAIFPASTGDTPRDRTLRERAQANRAAAARLARSGAGNDTDMVRGTLWAAYNGVTDLLDHHPPERTPRDLFLRSVWFGKREQLKRRAAREAEKIAADAKS